MKNRIYLFALCIILSRQISAQDQYAINPMQALLSYNPSFAGSNGFIRHQVLSNYTTSEKNLYNGFDAYIKPLKAGIALTVNNNTFFDYWHYNNAAITYAQHFSLLHNTFKIIPSIKLSFEKDQQGIFFLDNTSGQNRPLTKKYIDLTGGLLLNYKTLYAGVSIANLNRPDIGYFGPFRQPIAVTFNISYTALLSERHLLNFYIYNNRQSGYNQFMAGANAVLFKHLVLGTGFKFNGYAGISGSMGYRHNFFSVIFSYSRYAQNTLYEINTWNLGLSFNLRNKEQRRQLTAIEAW